MIRRMTRSTLMIGALIASMTLGVQPVLAETVVSTTGSVGHYQFLDNHGTTPGANCDYKTHKVNGTHRLADISIRAPKVFARNSSHPNTPRVVGWRFRIQHDTVLNGAHYSTVFTSPVVKAQATVSKSANFSRRFWIPASTPKGNFRAQVTIYWYQNGSSTKVMGKVVALIDFYQVRGGGPDTVRQTNCFQEN